MRRTTVLSLPPQLVFPDLSFHATQSKDIVTCFAATML
jgi:hypothetical protein